MKWKPILVIVAVVLAVCLVLTQMSKSTTLASFSKLFGFGPSSGN